VEWSKFIDWFCKEFKVRDLKYKKQNEEDVEVKCLKAIVAVDSNDPTNPEKIVSLESFGNMCSFFGPLTDPVTNKCIIFSTIKDVVINDWFFGAIGKDDAEALLTGKERGVFLIRLSTTNKGCFTVSKVTRQGNIAHQRIQYTPRVGFSFQKRSGTITENVSLSNFLEKVKAELGLSVSCPGNPFKALFLAKPALDGYLAMADDVDDDDEGEDIDEDLDNFLPD